MTVPGRLPRPGPQWFPFLCLGMVMSPGVRQELTATPSRWQPQACPVRRTKIPPVSQSHKRAPPAPRWLGKPGEPSEGRWSWEAKVEVVQKPVFWRRKGENDHKPFPDVGVYAVPRGLQVRCEGTGRLRLWVLPEPVLYKTGDGWLTIPYVTPTDQSWMNAALRDLLRTAGRLRSEVTVLSPQEDGLVWPETFIISWVPLSPGTRVSLTLRAVATEETLREEADLDGATGQRSSPEIRTALRRWRDRQGGDTHLDGVNLIFAVQGGDTITVPFALLSRTKEHALRTELSFWDTRARGLLRALGRGQVFWKYGLLPESAAEYERALLLHPADPIVRQRTIEANRMIGNRARVEQLERGSPGLPE